MQCTKCGEDTKVLNTRELKDGTKKRRRECKACGARISTYEALENTAPEYYEARLVEEYRDFDKHRRDLLWAYVALLRKSFSQ